MQNDRRGRGAAGGKAELHRFEGHRDPVRPVAFSVVERQVASASYDWVVKLRDAGRYRLQQNVAGHSDWILSVALCSRSWRVPSGLFDGRVQLWALDGEP